MNINKPYLMAIDIGNTNIHLGLWDGTSWRLSWRARTVPNKMPDEYAVLVRNFINSADIKSEELHGVIISCVVPPLTATFKELVERYIHLTPLMVSSTTPMGFEIAIDHPQQAGADRLANAAAVIGVYGGGPAIVIDFGTATNFDIISSLNQYIGGALAPGIGISHDALVSRAARLYKVDIEPPPDPIGRNTMHALQSGIFWGYVGLTEGLITRIKDSLGHSATVIATGGLAPLIEQHTEMIDRIIPELTLDGLRYIYELNKNQKTP